MSLIALTVVAVVFLGFLALLIDYARSKPPTGREIGSPAAASAPAAPKETAVEPAPPAASNPGPEPGSRPLPFVEGDDDEDVTFKTLAVVGKRPFLKEISGPSRSKRTLFLSATGVTTIGRSRSNDIVLAEEAASAAHCRIEKRGDTYVLTDLDSTNKTWVNGAEKQQIVLRNGDQVKVGDTTMIFALFGDRT